MEMKIYVVDCETFLAFFIHVTVSDLQSFRIELIPLLLASVPTAVVITTGRVAYLSLFQVLPSW